MVAAREESDVGTKARNIALSRSAAYQFFADLLVRPPDHEGRTAEDLAEQWRLHLGAGDPDGGEVVSGVLAHPELDWAVLNAEFSALFIIPSTGYLAPVESVYRAAVRQDGLWNVGRLGGPPKKAVQLAYQGAGFELVPGTVVEPDHMSCELEFLAFLCAKEADAWAEADADAIAELMGRQGEFLEAHPAGWVDILQDRLQSMLPHPYFAQAFATLVAFLEVERTHLRAAED